MATDTRLLLSHESDSNSRVSRHLSEYGIDCVVFDPTGHVYSLDSDGVPDSDVGLVYPSRLIEGGVVTPLGEIDWVNGLEEVAAARNKAETVAHLRRDGLPVPETYFVSNPVGDDDVVAAFEEIDGKAVVKPNSSTRGNGVTVVEDPDSLLGVTDYLDVIHESPLVYDRTFLVQEYIEDARDYRVMVVDGEYVGAVERRSEGWKHNVHRGAEAVSVTPDDEVVQLAEEAAESLGIRFCGVDLLRNEGRTVVNEVNARPTVDTRDKYEDAFYPRLARLIESTA
ncbi:RimK family alpha-L-glutamate ligase [Halorutilales archaeon Cl-col2-1]